MRVAFREGVRVIAHHENRLQTDVTKAETPIGSSSAVTPLFGDAFAEAKAASAKSAATSAADSQRVKKIADKKADTAAASDGKGEKTVPTTDLLPTVPANNKTLTTAPVPLQDAATSEPSEADASAGSEDFTGSVGGSKAGPLSGLNGAANGSIAGSLDQSSVLSARERSPAVLQKPGTVSLPSTSHGPTSLQPSTTSHQSAASQSAASHGNSVDALDSDEPDASTDGLSAGGASTDSDLASNDDGQAAGSNAVPGSAADPAAMLETALPTAPATLLNANGCLTGSESALGLSTDLSGLSAVANGTKGSLPGTNSAAAKSKSTAAGLDSNQPPAAASFPKAAEAVQASTPGGGINANAGVVTASSSVHGGTTGAGASQTDAKTAQTGSSASGSEGSEKALTPNAPQSWDASSTQVVHRAQLIQAMHQSEMRMGMNSAEFGNISISAAVNHQTLSAQISLDHAGLSRALTAQLPEIEKNLGSAYGLQSRVEVRDSSSMGQQGSPRGNGESSQRSVRGSATLSQPVSASALDSVTTANYSPAAGMRLDIVV